MFCIQTLSFFCKLFLKLNTNHHQLMYKYFKFINFIKKKKNTEV